MVKKQVTTKEVFTHFGKLHDIQDDLWSRSIYDLEKQTNISWVTSYAVVNGKCAWCGKNAKRLSNAHFDKHTDKQK